MEPPEYSWRDTLFPSNRKQIRSYLDDMSYFLLSLVSMTDYRECRAERRNMFNRSAFELLGAGFEALARKRDPSMIRVMSCHERLVYGAIGTLRFSMFGEETGLETMNVTILY
jgi:hypothetical protein